MGKTWDTKKKIIKLLSKRQMTLTEISSELGLVPSTVSQHIENLRDMGAISEVDNPYVKKWRYYRANPEFDVNRFVKGEPMSNRMPLAIGVIVALAIVVGFGTILLLHGSTTIQNPINGVTFSLTDPPSVPPGTQSLIINYSSIKAHIAADSNNTGWINATGSGSINLLTLINESQIIASADIPSNTAINAIKFQITAAHIILNGTTYNVTVPNDVVFASVASNGTINSKSNILIDLSPTVAGIYAASNYTIFVMVPSAKAIVIYGNKTTVTKFGYRQNLTGPERQGLKYIKTNVTVSSGSIYASPNNITHISVIIQNNANVPITLHHLSIFGEFNVSIYPINGSIHPNIQDRITPQILPTVRIDNNILTANASGYANNQINSNYNISSNTWANINPNWGGHNWVLINNNQNISEGSNILSTAINTNVAGNIHIGIGGRNKVFVINNSHNNGSYYNIYKNIHVVLINGTNITEEQHSDIDDLVGYGMRIIPTRSIYLSVNSNGTLTLPFSEHDFENSEASQGYVIQPMQSATFTFNSVISTANGKIIADIVPDTNYRIVIQGIPNTFVMTNVTAT